MSEYLRRMKLQQIDQTMINMVDARKILGKKADSMTDKQIQIVLNSLYRLAETVVDQVVNIIPAEQKASKKELKNEI